jgi:Protein of unknown function with PCYCGC motif
MVKRSLGLALLLLVTLVISARWVVSVQAQEGTGVPAFNATPPAKGAKLPPILSKDQLWGENSRYSFQTHSYDLAAKIPNVLHQQPCYCYCDRMGHNSLHSCFENAHGAQCSTCMKELYYSYAETKKGKTAKQIREGIIAGEWKQVDLRATDQIN